MSASMPLDKPNILIDELFHIRNQYGVEFAGRKRDYLEKIPAGRLKGKKAIETYYHTLLFLRAYPDNRTIYELAKTSLQKLEEEIKADATVRASLYNTGVTGSQVCAEFGFEIAKWLRKRYGANASLDSMTAPDGQILYILSAVMPQVESEILQDENSTWKVWLKKVTLPGEDLLDTLIQLFDQSPIRPEVKDELWSALGINISVDQLVHEQLPPELISVHYHRSLIKKGSLEGRDDEKPVKINLTVTEAEKIIECGRMTLVRYIKEIDPISFTDPDLVSYYQLSRGLSIALFGMRPERRHPLDCYMGYMVFKNGLPLAYAGSWVLFDSARIGLNVFPSFRGGESLHTFEQILRLHKQVYHLNRFSTDPYQIGKHNDDGIKSGAFWIYYKLGFRPIRGDLKQMAESEAEKLATQKGYRTPEAVLRKLADSRMEIVVGKGSCARFDATDLSKVYAAIVRDKYAGNRLEAERDSYKKLVKYLRPPKLTDDETLRYVLHNWCVILMNGKVELLADKAFATTLKEIMLLKANGNEEDYMRQLRKSTQLRKLVEAGLSLI